MAGSTRLAPIPGEVIASLPVPAVITSDAWEQGGATITFANREFCALTGYTAAELTGKNTRLLHGPRTDVPIPRKDAPGGVATRGEGEGWLYPKSGREFFARWQFNTLGQKGPGPMVVVYRDDSELWRQREGLLEAQKLGTIGLLAGGVAHDFNNLLSVINGYAEIMGPKVEGMPAQGDLQEIQRAGLKAAAIARQILEFSRRHETDPKVINFNTLIREIAEIIRRVGGETVTLELRLASDLGNARISPTQFQQVLLNLCFNARDAMMPKGGTLSLRTFNHQSSGAARSSGLPAGAYVALQVRDTGIGIGKKEQARIFEPFYTTKPQGTGLGLPTARGIIRGAHGHLLLESTLGKGTAFTIYLPETAEREEVGPTTLGTLPTAKGTEAVLVIEQDEGLRKMIAGILVIDGYTVHEAPTVAGAAQQDSNPQLIIIDNGSEAADEFIRLKRSANAQLRVICTADQPPMQFGEPDANQAHLPKPFALSSLLTKAREMLDAGSKG